MFIFVGSVTDFNLHSLNGGSCVTNLLFVNVPAKAFANRGATTLLTVYFPAFCKVFDPALVKGATSLLPNTNLTPYINVSSIALAPS